MSEEEIKAALWSLKAFKAPGLDGLHTGFFQRFWLIVGNLVISEIKKAFADRRVSEYLNTTHIALIPKIHGPKTLNNYRPISLCSTMYKIMPKIIVARLRPYLDKLIFPYQSAFVPGRKGIDNAIIVQDVIHSLSKKKGKVGYMALKIDLEKVYDKLEWSFTRDMLIRVNMPTDLINTIMSYMTTVSTSIVSNGEALDPIYPSKGLRQGDPLSPHFFILCMDFLGHLIENKCNANLWKPVKVSQRSPSVSHLMFTDDLDFFAKADNVNCCAIRDVLDEFCKTLGQTVSEANSRVFFPPNVDMDDREAFCDILGFAPLPALESTWAFPLDNRACLPKSIILF